MLLGSYIAGCVLVALRLSWHLSSNLDHFDWRFNSRSIKLRFARMVIFWPFTLVFRFGSLIDPTSEFRHGLTVQAYTVDRTRLWECPPRCGNVIRYRQKHGRYEDVYGDFLFASADVEESAIKLLQDNPCPPDRIEGETEAGRWLRLGSPYIGEAGYDESAILNWVRGRSDDATFVTEVPREWKRFNTVASDLILNGKGKITCIKCCAKIPTADVRQDQLHSRSWSFYFLCCPHGHHLLENDAIHFHRSDPAIEE